MALFGNNGAIPRVPTTSFAWTSVPTGVLPAVTFCRIIIGNSGAPEGPGVAGFTCPSNGTEQRIRTPGRVLPSVKTSGHLTARKSSVALWGLLEGRRISYPRSIPPPKSGSLVFCVRINRARTPEKQFYTFLPGLRQSRARRWEDPRVSCEREKRRQIGLGGKARPSPSGRPDCFRPSIVALKVNSESHLKSPQGITTEGTCERQFPLRTESGSYG